ncbi:MAG: SDR family oxidoreductase [Armatimonadetes bacterium]|nr:SDR family oxidoreductase [Armatimonadota bacterium]MDW8028342.1 SDR family oxidoreductase [Armatimonadota bacterium]
MQVLVVGATGYVGSHLVPALLEMGCKVRCLARSAAKLRPFSWASQVEVVEGDAENGEAVRKALTGVQVAYYLLHSLTLSDFESRDAQIAEQFGRIAKQKRVKQIVYLGGLGDEREKLSRHLKSRHETGQRLRVGGVPVLEFRSAVIIGAGSLSFETVRYLTERLPVMVCPRWVKTKLQPIAISDVIAYLTSAMKLKPTDAIVEIGSPDVATYLEMMRYYAELRRLRRFMVVVPVLTPELASYWVGLVTPISARIARPLIEGLRNDLLVLRHEPALRLFPEIRPMSWKRAMLRAVKGYGMEADAEGFWQFASYEEQPVGMRWERGRVIETRKKVVNAPAEFAFDVVSNLGGETGWLYADALWQLRGFLDWLVGGVGMRRGRPERPLRVGDTVDFWRVEAIEPPSLLRLKAEMRLPGEAWLQFRIVAKGEKSLLIQTAVFEPMGLIGLFYWYSLLPLHSIVFAGLCNAIAERAEQMSLKISSELKKTRSGR